jgi:hypothetical protein
MLQMLIEVAAVVAVLIISKCVRPDVRRKYAVWLSGLHDCLDG